MLPPQGPSRIPSFETLREGERVELLALLPAEEVGGPPLPAGVEKVREFPLGDQRVLVLCCTVSPALEVALVSWAQAFSRPVEIRLNRKIGHHADAEGCEPC